MFSNCPTDRVHLMIICYLNPGVIAGEFSLDESGL